MLATQPRKQVGKPFPRGSNTATAARIPQFPISSGSSAAPLATGHGHWDETSGCFYPAFVPEYQQRRDPTLLPSPARSGGCGMRRRRLGIERLKERTKKMNTASWPGARVPDSSPEKVTFKTGLSDSFDAAAFALGESSATRRC
jgi:hypothetical protein